jgi:hypothetical protein
MNDDKIVIATDNCEKALWIIAKAATKNDVLIIQFTNKYEPTVDHLMNLLRKGFGWMEVERGFAEIQNMRCIYNNMGKCMSKDKNSKLMCTESVRRGCQEYKSAFTNTFRVNTVTIEKAGGIRGL